MSTFRNEGLWPRAGCGHFSARGNRRNPGREICPRGEIASSRIADVCPWPQRGKIEFADDVNKPAIAGIDRDPDVHRRQIATNPNTGAVSHPVCGTPSGLQPPDCWQGDGFGFQAFADTIDVSPGGWLQIVDNGIELAAIEFLFTNDQPYSWRMVVNEDNQVAISLWVGSEPLDPTLVFTNGGSPYTPIASGDSWQLEVRNANDDLGLSHSHTTTWDDFRVATDLIFYDGFESGDLTNWSSSVGS